MLAPPAALVNMSTPLSAPLHRNFPLSSWLGSSTSPSSTRAMVVSLTNAATIPSNSQTIWQRRELAFDGQRRWLSLRLHSLRTPPGADLPLGYLSSSPLMTSRKFATLVLDGARLCAPILARIPPGHRHVGKEKPTSCHAAPDDHPQRRRSGAESSHHCYDPVYVRGDNRRIATRSTGGLSASTVS